MPVQLRQLTCIVKVGDAIFDTGLLLTLLYKIQPYHSYVRLEETERLVKNSAVTVSTYDRSTQFSKVPNTTRCTHIGNRITLRSSTKSKLSLLMLQALDLKV